MTLTLDPAKLVAESRSPLLASRPGWPRRPLGQVATILNGFAFSSKQFSVEEGMPLIRIRDIFNSNTSSRYVGQYDTRYVVHQGDLLVGMDGDFNCALWTGPDALLNQRVCKITPHPDYLDLNYLSAILPAYLQAIHDATSSTTVTHLSSLDIARLPVPVPSLADQRALATFMASVASKSASSLAHASRATSTVERLRQAVLRAACSGRLTEDWRVSNPHTEPAGNLVNAITRSRNSRVGRKSAARIDPGFKLPPSWTWTTIGGIADVATGATPLRKRGDYYGGEIPWVTSAAVNAGNITEPTDYITDRALHETNAKVFQPGTLLVAMYGEGQTRGRVGELRIAAATNQALAAIVFDKSNDSLRDYLRIFLLYNYERVRLLSVGGVQPNLSLGVIRDIPVPLPPLAEQREIVKRASQLLNRANTLHERIERATQHVERSAQAILAKALGGEVDYRS